MAVGYLISQYPAASHTFIRREVEMLRSQGLVIETFSVRKPSIAEAASQSDRTAFETTFYILPMDVLRLAGAHFRAVLRHPLRYFATMRLAARHRAFGWKAILWSAFHFAESIVLAQELERRRIAHLHNHFANAGATVGLLATQFLGISWSLTLHGISETDYPAGLLLAKKIEAATFVACASWFGRAQAMRLSPPDQWTKLSVVRCGVDLAGMPASSATRTGQAGVKRIICVGRLSPEKGHLGLLEAIAALLTRGRAVELVLVGDGPERQLVEQGVATLGLSGIVRFLGRLDETETLNEISQADLLVLPSFMEGLPVVLMEVMALRIPVIASRVAGTPELIAEPHEGLLFQPSDWTDLANKMDQMLSDEAMRNTRIEAARTKIEAEFDIRLAVAPLAAHFESLSRHPAQPDRGQPQ